MDITMAVVGNTVVAPLVAPLSSAPTQFLFDAVNDLSKMYLSKKWTGSIKFCSLPVYRLMIGLPLDKMSIEEVDICDYLGWPSSHPSVVCLNLDANKYDKPPADGEPLKTNLHWMQLKDALASGGCSHLRIARHVQWWRQRQL
jgi:hypothetical protein